MSSATTTQVLQIYFHLRKAFIFCEGREEDSCIKLINFCTKTNLSKYFDPHLSAFVNRKIDLWQQPTEFSIVKGLFLFQYEYSYLYQINISFSFQLSIWLFGKVVNFWIFFHKLFFYTFQKVQLTCNGDE